MTTLQTAFETISCAYELGPTAVIAPGVTNPGTTLNVTDLMPGVVSRSSLVQAIAWWPVGSNPSAAPTVTVTWQSASGAAFTYNASTDSLTGASFWFYLPPTTCQVSVSVTNNDGGSDSINFRAELQVLSARAE